jgi:hypothetical protein
MSPARPTGPDWSNADMKPSTTRRRLSLAAVLAALALTFAACGADGDDGASSTTTTSEASADDTTTTTEADDTTTTESDEPTTTESEDSTTTQPNGPSTSGSIGGMAKDVLVDTYQKMGMTKKQAECAADFLVDKMGNMDGMDDISGLAEMGKDMAKECDIDPSDLKVPSGN